MHLPLSHYERLLLLYNKVKGIKASGYRDNGLPIWFGIPSTTDKTIENWMSKYSHGADVSKHWINGMQVVHGFAISGKNRYMLTEELIGMLASTDYNSIPCKFLKCPHEYYSIDLSNSEWIIGPDKILEVLIRRVENGLIIVPCTKDSFHISLFFRWDEEGNDNALQFIKEHEDKNKYPNNADLHNLVRFVVSIILYINTGIDEAPVIKPKPKLFKTDTSIPVCMLGTVISLNKGKYGISKGMSTHEIKVLKWPVRGHFRQQACGKNHKEHKIVWIEPFFKGSERHAQITAKPHNYSVQTN